MVSPIVANECRDVCSDACLVHVDMAHGYIYGVPPKKEMAVFGILVISHSITVS